MSERKKDERDQAILSRLAQIQHRVDSLEQTQAFALRADAGKHFAEVKKIFGRGERKAQVYLAANGRRTVNEIADHLKMKRQNVGRILNSLGEEGLLEILDTPGKGDAWSKKPLDRTLRISKFLRETYGLSDDGLKK